MISRSDFRLRAAQELIEIRDEVLDLATDRDLLLHDTYAHSTASRVRRLVDQDRRTISLRRLIAQLGDYPDLLVGKSVDEVERDVAELDRTCTKVKDYADQFVAHYDRTSSAPVPTYRDLNEAIDTLIAIFRKYYALIHNADIDVVVSYEDDPLAIFRFAWIDGNFESPIKR